MRTKARFFLTSKLARRYLYLFLIVMWMPALFVGACLYHVIFRVVAEELAMPETILMHLLPALERVNTIMWFALPALFILLLLWAMTVAHRLIGPVQRLERELDTILEGKDPSRRIHLRQGDDLKPVADRINRLLDSMR
ncbi:MAG: hypothetical protein JW937_07700 [Candidatus Omnitrophica bacterium]|nr:hypothetical protein [Candidatus Omnitrophota bacterium]